MIRKRQEMKEMEGVLEKEGVYGENGALWLESRMQNRCWDRSAQTHVIKGKKESEKKYKHRAYKSSVCNERAPKRVREVEFFFSFVQVAWRG